MFDFKIPKDYKTRLWLQKKLEDKSWSIKDGMNLLYFPENLCNKIYDAAGIVYFRNRLMKGKIIYYYIPKDYTIDKIPIIIRVEYNSDMVRLPEDATILPFRKLKEIFVNNKFEG